MHSLSWFHDCEVTPSSDVDDIFVGADVDDAAALSAELDQADEEAQDAVDQLSEAAMGEGSSFIEKSDTIYGGFFRTLGVVFLFLLLLLACTGVGFIIGALIVNALIAIGFITIADGLAGAGQGAFYALLSLGVSLIGCAYQLTQQLLPALEQ